MKILKKLLLLILLGFAVLIAAFNIWGFLTLGTIVPAVDPATDNDANRVTMVFGATGSVGDGLLKAAIEDPDVKKVYVITRRTSPRIDAGIASGKVEMRLHQDFTEYASMSDALAETNTVLWGLGTSSLQVDDATYTWIHVDFPVAFVSAWLAARTEGPMSFHYVTGMGTDPEGSAHWAQEKGRAERELAALAGNSDLRTFSYHSAYIRPASEQAHAFNYLGEALLRPGALVITAKELGEAMLEISARSDELPNGSIVDNADSIHYAKLYQQRKD
ncbi:MAG: hypothetical protein V7700_08070 [Halioglobus sp.]